MDGFLLSLYAAAGGFTTSNRLSPGRRSQDFDPCSLCGEGQRLLRPVSRERVEFQPSLSLWRATVSVGVATCRYLSFQPALSSRRATTAAPAPVNPAPYFNPRSPCGERRRPSWWSCRAALFQSTLSSRRATPQHPVRPAPSGISIHALLTESDSREGTPDAGQRNFNPRSPHGERRHVCLHVGG